MFSEEPGENHHESDDDEGVDEGVPGGQLYHGSVCRLFSYKYHFMSSAVK